MKTKTWIEAASLVLLSVGCSSTTPDAPAVAGAGGASGGASSAGSGGPAVVAGAGGGSAGVSNSAGSGGNSGAGAGAGGMGGNSSGGASAGSGGASGQGGASGGAGPRACGAGLVPIPSKDHSFMFGLDKATDDPPLQGNGEPWACYLGKHKVTFSYDFCMDSTLVTQADFTKVMGFNPSKHQTADATLPVDSETWYDAVLYCNKKSQAEGLQPAYTLGAITLNGKSASNIADVTVDIKKNGYRLPTNAEYEYAERGGTTGFYFFSPTKTANITQFGAVYAWYTDNSKMRTQPVRGLKANPYGLYDIVGNLFEWEHDWEGPYATTDEVDPTGPTSGTGCGGFSIGIQKMAKGGSWHTDVATHMRIGYHYKWSPNSVHAELGFRCVATSTP